MSLYFVGQVKNEEEYEIWEWQGIFDTKQKAIDACKTWKYFYAPCILNKEIQEKAKPMPNAVYPIIRV